MLYLKLLTASRLKNKNKICGGSEIQVSLLKCYSELPGTASVHTNPHCWQKAATHLSQRIQQKSLLSFEIKRKLLSWICSSLRCRFFSVSAAPTGSVSAPKTAFPPGQASATLIRFILGTEKVEEVKTDTSYCTSPGCAQSIRVCWHQQSQHAEEQEQFHLATWGGEECL